MSIQETEVIEEVEQTTKISIYISKMDEEVEFDTSEIPDDMYQAALKAGLKLFAEKGLTTITKSKHPNPEELKAKAKEKVLENIEAIKDGTFKVGRGGSAKAKVSGELQVEARAIAKKMVKEAIRAEGQRVAAYSGREISAMAETALKGENGPAIYEMATQALKARANLGAAKGKLGLTFKTDPEAKRKPRKAPISAKQAGQPAVRTSRGDVRPSR